MRLAPERVAAARVAAQVGEPADRFRKEKHLPASAPERVGQPVKAGLAVGVQVVTRDEDDAFHAAKSTPNRSAQRMRLTQRQMRKSKRARPAFTASQSRRTTSTFSAGIDRARSLASVYSTHGPSAFSQRASGVAK